MTNLRKRVLSIFAAHAMLVGSSQALAITTPPACGNYDFNVNNIECQAKIEPDCAVYCSSLNFQAGCAGLCTDEPILECTDDCGTKCQTSCELATFDCVAVCETECENLLISKCQAEYPERDCETAAKSSCAFRCRESCTSTPPSTCEGACASSCDGSCTSIKNFDCDIACFTKLEGRCKSHCKQDGALLVCKDKDGVFQSVNATDVGACIIALHMQGLRIDDSAFCRLNGCDGGGGGTTDEGSCACSTLPGDDSPFTVGAWIATALGAGFSVARRKNQSRNRI